MAIYWPKTLQTRANTPLLTCVDAGFRLFELASCRPLIGHKRFGKCYVEMGETVAAVAPPAATSAFDRRRPGRGAGVHPRRRRRGLVRPGRGVRPRRRVPVKWNVRRVRWRLEQAVRRARA